MEYSGYDKRQEKLANKIRDFHKQLNKQAKYDQQAYCDELESEVLMTFGSEIKRLEEMRDEYLNEIHAHRSNILRKFNSSMNEEFLFYQESVIQAFDKLFAYM